MGSIPGVWDFRSKKISPAVLHVALPARLLRRRVLRIALNVGGTRDMFVCEHSDYRPMSDVSVQRRAWIGDVEPPLVPTLQGCFEAKTEVILASPLAELQTGVPNYTDLAALLIRLEGKDDEDITTMDT